MEEVLAKLGNPHHHLGRVIHVAGTNGKGSITAILKSILQEQGFSINRYTSPHIKRFNERIEIKDAPITDHELNELSHDIQPFLTPDITPFEKATILGFVAFSKNPADYTIIEVGLGGRLDATNVIPNTLCDIISTVHYDHEHFLGNTLEKIAREKLGIVKDEKSLVIVGRQEDTLYPLFKSVVPNAKIYGRDFYTDGTFTYIDERTYDLSALSLQGRHQKDNASTAIAALHFLNLLPNDQTVLDKALSQVVWDGRIQKKGSWIVDGAHNAQGIQALRNYLSDIDWQPSMAICTLKSDKDPHIFKNMMPFISKMFYVEMPQIEGMTFHTYEEICKFYPSVSITSVSLSELESFTKNHLTDPLLIFGSLYLLQYI